MIALRASLPIADHKIHQLSINAASGTKAGNQIFSINYKSIASWRSALKQRDPMGTKTKRKKMHEAAPKQK